MFSNEGLGGGGQRAQRGGSMAGTVGRGIPQYFSQKTGMGHLEQQTNRVRQGWGRGGEPLRTHRHGTLVGYKKCKS
jgi:hypothetical protein